MSAPLPPPPPGAPPQKKKGLSVLAWVLIGCLGIVVLGGIAVVATGWWATQKLKGFAEKMEKDPNYAARKAAELVVRMSPDLELVSTDEAAGTMTVRNTKTNETVTLSFDEISKGNLSFESGGKTTDVSFGGGEGGGTLRVETSEGTATFGAGADAADVPEWFPVYPGARTEGHAAMAIGGQRSGTFTLRTSDSPEAVIAFFKRELAGLGLEVSTTTMDVPGAPAALITGTSSGGRQVSVTLSREGGETAALVTYGEQP